MPKRLTDFFFSKKQTTPAKLPIPDKNAKQRESLDNGSTFQSGSTKTNYRMDEKYEAEFGAIIQEREQQLRSQQANAGSSGSPGPNKQRNRANARASINNNNQISESQNKAVFVIQNVLKLGSIVNDKKEPLFNVEFKKGQGDYPIIQISPSSATKDRNQLAQAFSAIKNGSGLEELKSVFSTSSWDAPTQKITFTFSDLKDREQGIKNLLAAPQFAKITEQYDYLKNATEQRDEQHQKSTYDDLYHFDIPGDDSDNSASEDERSDNRPKF